MHSDSQLVYCPITYILALAYADSAFEASGITPEYVLRLKVPNRLHALPIRWKEDMKSIPIFRRPYRTTSGIDIHPTLPVDLPDRQQCFATTWRACRLSTSDQVLLLPEIYCQYRQ